MCGIAGFVSVQGWDTAAENLPVAVTRLRHRGPDGQGLWQTSDRHVGLAHARLAILDVAGGAQPLTNEDGTVVTTFNGEIYNHVELRRELEARGHYFSTDCDTEVLVHGYEEWGCRLLERLVGMFAFAIYDHRQRKLLLARDRLGKKPLFFASCHHGVAFASEIKGLMALTNIEPRFRPEAIADYLTLEYVPGDVCAYEGIEKLQGGEYLTWQEGRWQRDRYWEAPHPRPTFKGTFADAAVELRSRLREATQLRLRSDVPLGALLSGGIDSSLIVGLMAEAGAGRIRTFTASFGGLSEDERPYAAAVADRFATDHEELLVSAPDLHQVESIMRHYDEPFADSSAIPTWMICDLASQRVKVVLTGDGGDEVALGYERYQQLNHYIQQRRWLYPVLHASGLHHMGQWLCPVPGPRTWKRRLRTLTSLWDEPPASVYERWISGFSSANKRRLYTPAFAKQLGGFDSTARQVRKDMAHYYKGNWIAAAGARDLVTYLPDAVLTKVDRASMAHGLECRSPLLDHRVVEFLATLPAHWKFHPRHGSKWILRYACRDLLPDRVYRRGKTGFGSPVGKWFRQDWRHELERICFPKGECGDWLDSALIREMIAEHQAGTVDHTYRLWTLACLHWATDVFPARVSKPPGVVQVPSSARGANALC